MATRALVDLQKRVASKGNKSFPNDIFDKLTSVLSFLTATSENPSQSFILSFQELFSKEIVVLYESQPSLTLKLTSSIVTDLFKSRLSPLLKLEKSKQNMNHIGTWEGLLRGVLNGIQTYIDGNNPDMIQLGGTLYKPLFAMLRSTSGLNLSARIRTQAYSLLADTAADCADNRELLRQKTILGGSRLGGIIASTNEYLVLDSLYQLLARLTPSSRDVTGRADLAKDVFQNARAKKAFGKKACDELAAILRDARGDQWEKTTDQFITTIARTDRLKPQPFRLMSNEIHANTFVYNHPQSLDRIYLDCSGVVVNVQEGDSIDCLEVDYGSIVSVQLQERSCEEAGTNLHVVLSLSSPPIIGLGPVLCPPGSDISGQYFKFEIAVEDSEEFKATVEARGMGVLIHRTSGSHSKFKSSILAGGPLDLNSVPVTSLGEKSKEVETFYATSSPEEKAPQMGSKPKQTHKHMPSTESDEAINSRPHPNVDGGLDMVAEKPAKLPATNLRPSKPVIDSDESTTDLGSLNLEATVPMPRHNKSKQIPGVARQGEVIQTPENAKTLPKTAESLGPDEKLLISGSTIQATSKPLKRRREVDDSTDEETRKGKVTKLQPLYDSQLLRPVETATTRSTTKYTARTRKSSPFPCRSHGDFDAIPSTSRPPAPPKPNSAVDVVPLEDSNTTSRPKNTKVSGNAKRPKSSKPSWRNKKREHAEDSSITAGRTRRPGRKVTIIESEDEADDTAPITNAVSLDELKDRTTMPSVTTLKSPLLVAPKTGEKTKLKKAPWKNMVQLDSIEDSSFTCNAKANTEAHDANIPDEIHTHHQEKIISSLDFEDPLRIFPAIAPISLEPLDLDLAVAQGEGLGMDVDFDRDFNPVTPVDMVSKGPLATPIISFKKVESDHDDFAAGILLQSGDPHAELTLIDKPKHSSLKGVVCQKASQIIPSPNPRLQSPLTFSIKDRPPRRIETIDLTHVDEEEAEKYLQDELFSVNTSADRREKKFSTPRRPTVTFAPHTKDSPDHNLGMAFKSRLVGEKAKVHSLIPRLRVNRERHEDIIASCADMTKMRNSSRFQREHQPLELSRGPPQSSRFQPADSESDDGIEREMDADQKIVAVLNKIQEVILGNMNNKFNGAATHTRAVTTDLRLFATEDIKKIRDKSGEHRKNLVHLEAKYAKYGREMRNGFEEQIKTNADIDKRLRQAVLDHDKHGLSKKMPRSLASRPKIFLSFAT